MKMQERKLKKFAVYSKIANVLFVLVVVFGSIFIAAAIGASIYLKASGTDLADVVNLISRNALPTANLILPEGITISLSIIAAMIIHLASGIALTAYIIKSVSLIFQNTTKDQTPFTLKTVRYVKSIGIAFLIYAGIVFIMSIITGYIAPNPSFNMTINGRSILIGLLVFLIGEIFEFGMGLQQDSESIV